MKTGYYYHHYFIAVLMSVCGFCFYSCSGLLEEDPSHIGTSDTYFPTTKGFEAGVNACYAQLRTIHSDKTIWLHGTDQFHRNGYWPATNTVFSQWNDYSVTAVNAESGVVTNFWNAVWIGINRCNSVLGLADKIDLSVKDKRLAEVKTLRALYYYFLVEQFGDIPFPLEPYTELQITAERIPEETVYAQLISDLEECIPVLPDSPDNFGRITKGAAQFLLSKLYLTRGYKPYRQPDDFASAARHADRLISSGTFELLPQYHKIFLPGNEKNKEIIFSVQWSSDLNLNGGGNNIHSKFGFYLDHAPGCTRSNYYNRGQHVHKETFHTVDCFGVDTVNNIGKSYIVPAQRAGLNPPPAGYSYKQDKRYNATFLRLVMAEITRLGVNKPYGPADLGFRAVKVDIYARTGGTNGELTEYPFSGIEEHINQNYWIGTGRDTAIYIPAPDEHWSMEKVKNIRYDVIPHEYWNQIVWERGIGCPFIFKFWEPQSGYNDNLGIRDMFLFRLGEAYLIAAEAYFKAGNVGEAVKRINTIRRRANGVGPDTPSIMDITPSDLDIDFILDERTRELAGEENRWVELKRTGKLIERTLKYNLFAGCDYIPDGPYLKEFHLLRPIPYSWLSLLQNKVPQNPGYGKE